MNIVSNCCAGAYMYKKFFDCFQNPFIWNVILYKDIKKLIIDWNNINFNNYKLLESNILNLKNIYKINIDESIDLHYTHYFYKEDVEYEKTNSDIFSNKITKYIEDKYKTRLSRMLNDNEIPKFLICDNKDGYTLEMSEIIDLNDIDTRYKIILASNKDLSNIKFKSNIKWINFNGWYHDRLCEKYGEDILDFFSK